VELRKLRDERPYLVELRRLRDGRPYLVGLRRVLALPEEAKNENGMGLN
jgi:hypothetical protein